MATDDVRRTVGDDPHRGAAPAGMTPVDVEGRSRLARHLDVNQFPATAAAIRDMARSANAPDPIVADLDRLPDGRYENVTDVWKALGHGVEEPRTHET